MLCQDKNGGYCTAGNCSCFREWLITLSFMAIAVAFCYMAYCFGHPPRRTDTTIIIHRYEHEYVIGEDGGVKYCPCQHKVIELPPEEHAPEGQ